MSAIVELDARRLYCPLPVIRLQHCIDKQAPGSRVRIVSTDPGSIKDIPSWCRIHGHEIMETRQRDKEYIFLVRKNDDES